MSVAALGISASGAVFSVALRTPRGDIAVRSGDARQLAGRLFPAVAELLAEASLAPGDVREVRVDRGPGSYTGLRIALTFARMLGAFAPVTILHATSFELMALAAWDAGLAPTTGAVRPILDARRDRWHTARVECVAGVARLTEAPRAVALAVLATALRPDETALAVPASLPQLAALGMAPGALPAYGATQLFHPALAPLPAAGSDLEPLYAMGPYTERPA